MKRMLLSLFFLASCATPLTKNELSFIFVEETSLTAENSYNMILGYLAKSLVDSNRSIQLKDPAKNRIISQIGIKCNDVKNGFMDIASYTTYFTIDAEFKNKKIRLSLNGDTYTSTNIDGSLIAINSPFKAHQKEGLKKCADHLKNEILTALKNSDNSNW